MKRSVIIVFMMLFATLSLAQENPFKVDVEARDDGKLQVSVGAPKKHYLYADQVEVKVNGEALKAFSAPEPVSKTDPFSGEAILVFTDGAKLIYELPDGPKSYRVVVSYLGCNDSLCFAPAEEEFVFGEPAEDAPPEVEPAESAGLDLTGFDVAGSASGYMKEEPFIDFLDDSLAGNAASPSGLEGKSVLVTLLLILVGGLALNLTPCVLPMIPINIAIIGAGVGAGSKSRGFLLGGAYGAGIALVYGLLGLVVLLTGATFGTLNASPWFNIGIAVIFAVLSMSMFGFINIDFSALQGKIKTDEESKGKVITSFFLGGIAALLAGACVAPVVISVLLLSADVYQQGNAAGLLLPFVLGIGMALPWPFAGAGVSFLPKPGAWMEKIKYAFGVIILVGAGYYAFLGISLFRDRSDDSRAEVIAAQESSIEEGWHTDLEAALSVARRDSKPVFIDFWASWCKNCLHMEKTTFKSEQVREKLDAFVRVKYQAERPNEPETRSVLDTFGVVGLPTYIVLVPDEE